MHQVKLSDLSAEETYKLLTGVVVPRPIAWVSTLSDQGLVNLAPFSCYTFVSTQPPLLGINMGRKAGQRKDTARNALARREFVVNIGNQDMVQAIHHSAIEYPPDVSEVDVLGLPLAPSVDIATPRLADVPISLECQLEQVIPFGDTGAEFVVGRILRMHADPNVMKGDRIDSQRLRPVCRLGGPLYGALGEFIPQPAIAQTPKSVMPPSVMPNTPTSS